MACGTDNVKKQVNLTGRWELRKAFRNQKETGNLAGTFFKFGDDGKMTTNLTGSDETADFTYEKDEILQKSFQPVKYQVKSSDDSSLTLVTTMRGIEFELQLARAPEPEEMPIDSSSLLLEGDSSDLDEQE